MVKSCAMKTKPALSLAVAAASLALSAAIPEIRHTSVAPFDGAGRRVAAAWSKADTCIRFVEVIKMDVALDQSEARLLFDDRNLYVSMTGFFDPKYARGDSSKPIFGSNNFEFKFKPEGGAEFHAVVDEFGRTYFAVNRGETTTSGASASVEKGERSWTANLSIPFSALGISAPKDDLKARVGIFRRNVNVHERQKMLSSAACSVSGYTPNKYNFTVSDEWAEMTLTRRAGTPRRVEGPNLGYRVNLFANPDFDVPGRGWHPFGNTTYQETMAMSGEWTYHTSGKDYQVLNGRPFAMKPNTRYTLVVKARSFGAGSGLRAVELVKDAKGKLYAGRYVTMLTPVGPDMHE